MTDPWQSIRAFGAAPAVLAAMAVLAAAIPAVAKGSTGAFEAAPCAAVIGYDHARVSCGWLDVAESARGRDLSLAVSVVAPEMPDTDEAPVVFLHGGPGGAIADAARSFASHPMAQRRTVILFDQRGSGLSRPLDCPEASKAFLDMLAADLSPSRSVAAQAAIEGACREDMLAAGADLEGYGTRQTVADMERLRAALGIETWNVMGVSYGTTVALDYARLHPQRVRALVLDSVYPPSLASGGDLNTRNFARALDELYAACRAGAACRDAFPGLETSFLATLMALEREPLAIPVSGAAPIDADSFMLNSQDFALIVQQMLYQRETASLVPRVVDLAAKRNGEALSGLIGVLGPLAQRIDLAARLAVECRDRWGMDGRTIGDLDRLERFLRRHFRFFDTEDVLCPDWAPTTTDAAFREPVASPVPALFYAGAMDPITPPENTAAVFRRFPAGQYVRAPLTGHGVDRAHACARNVTAAFLDAPRMPVPDGCMAALPAVAFVTDAALSRGVLPFATSLLQEMRIVPTAVLGIGMLAALVGAAWGLVVMRRPRRRADVPSLGAAAALMLAAAAAALFLAALVSAIVDAASGPVPAILALGLPSSGGWLLVLPWTIAALWTAGVLSLAIATAQGRTGTWHRRALIVSAAGSALVLIQLWVFGFFASVG